MRSSFQTRCTRISTGSGRLDSRKPGGSTIPRKGVIPFDEPIVTACGRADPVREAAFYCVIDEKIYYSTEFRTLIENQIGDFAWVIVVAHEWGHHIQAKLGFDLGVVPDRAGEVAPIELEQQADCLAGAYAIDAEQTGWLDPGDIEEALTITEISGDPTGDRLGRSARPWYRRRADRRLHDRLRRRHRRLRSGPVSGGPSGLTER